MSLYFWLGDNEPHADETDTAEWRNTETGAERIEDDGFMTAHPDLLAQQIRTHIPITVVKTAHGRSVQIGGSETLFITDGIPVCPRQIALNLTR